MSFLSTVQVTVQTKLTCVETPTAATAPAAQTQQVTENAFDTSQSLNASSAIPAQGAAYEVLTGPINGASGHINFSALQTLFGSQTFVGYKLRAMLINNLDPTNTFTIAVGAWNGYAIGGQPIVVQPGGIVEVVFANGLLAVDATHKILDWTGNAGTGNAQLAFVLG